MMIIKFDFSHMVDLTIESEVNLNIRQIINHTDKCVDKNKRKQHK